MAGRPRRSLWKRPNGSFRVGDRRRPDASDDPQRLTLFLSGKLLDLAETLTLRKGASSVQAYCETLLIQALQSELARQQVRDAEARHGPLEGLREIADDPEYLAEWNASVSPKEPPRHRPFAIRNRDDSPPSNVSDPIVEQTSQPASARTIIRHAGLDDGATGLIACLRRGDTPPSNLMIEVALALSELSEALAGEPAIDRRLAHALHRLAFESQVLLTDAWPDAFDSVTIQCIRDVQEAADLILSGAAPAEPEPGPVD